MTITLLVIAIGFIGMGAYWVVRMLWAMRWLRAHQCTGAFDRNRDIVVLIPVLDEAQRIAPTVRYFLQHFAHFPRLRIAIITTQAEYAKRTASVSKTTIDVVQSLCKRSPKLVHIHYPKEDGKMAHQLNYAMRHFLDQADCLFAVYNADSRPHPLTFDWVTSAMKRTGHQVFQQYGNYLENAAEFRSSIIDATLLAAACWQTRWSIGFEILHALQQPARRSRSLYDDITYPLNYCIGHGLFFTAEIYKALGGFNEAMHNEDSIFGLELSYLGERIVPVPFFDLSETPRSIRSLILQKANWFFGPLQAYSYLFTILGKRRQYEHVRFLRLVALSTKLFSHAVYWVVGPTLFAVSLILALAEPSMINTALLLAEICAFFGIPNTLAWHFAATDAHAPHRNIFLSQLIGGPMCYLLHGLSAYKTLLLVSWSALSGMTITKQKTPAYD